MTTLDDVEATVWRVISRYGRPRADEVQEIMDAVRALPDSTRRPPKPPAVHFCNPQWSRPSCSYGVSTIKNPLLTSDPASTTCERCKHSVPYRDALALAVAS